MIDGTRIEMLLESRGMSQSALARSVGVSQQTIWKLINGHAAGSKHIMQIARVLETSPEFLLKETDDPGESVGEHRNAFKGFPAQPSDSVALEEFDVSFGLGATYIHDTRVTGKRRVFSRDWIRQFTDSPFESLFWATGSGISMMPAIQDSDILLIDTEQRTPRMWDQFWALEMNGMGMIKALRPGKEGAMRIISINDDFKEELAYDGEMNVIGRVVAVVRKV